MSIGATPLSRSSWRSLRDLAPNGPRWYYILHWLLKQHKSHSFAPIVQNKHNVYICFGITQVVWSSRSRIIFGITQVWIIMPIQVLCQFTVVYCYVVIHMIFHCHTCLCYMPIQVLCQFTMVCCYQVTHVLFYCTTTMFMYIIAC